MQTTDGKGYSEKAIGKLTEFCNDAVVNAIRIICFQGNNFFGSLSGRYSEVVALFFCARTQSWKFDRWCGSNY